MVSSVGPHVTVAGGPILHAPENNANNITKDKIALSKRTLLKDELWQKIYD